MFEKLKIFYTSDFKNIQFKWNIYSILYVNGMTIISFIQENNLKMVPICNVNNIKLIFL